MPKFTFDEPDILDVLRSVYRPFEEILAKVLNKSLADVRQRRAVPKDVSDELFEHWQAQQGRYDDLAAKFIPKAIRCLQSRRLLARSPDSAALNRALYGTRLGWVIFPAYYRPLDFYNALDVQFGVRWWMVAASRTEQVTWESFASLRPWDEDVDLTAGNVLEFIEGTWLLSRGEEFEVQMRRAEVARLVRSGVLMGPEPQRIRDLAAREEYWERLSKVIAEIWEGLDLAELPLEERVAAKRRRGLPLSEEEQVLAEGKTLGEVLQERCQKEYSECPAERRLAEAVRRAQRGQWGWIRREAAARVYTPSWYVEIAALTRDPLARRKAEAANVFLTTDCTTDFYFAWEELAEPTEIEASSPADLPAPEFPATLGDYLQYCGLDIQALRERLVRVGDDVFLADDEAEKRWERGDVLAAAGIPGRLLSGECPGPADEP